MSSVQTNVLIGKIVKLVLVKETYTITLFDQKHLIL